MKMENLIRIENGEKVKHTFSDAEYASRQNKLRELMARENIDAVLFTSYHNINYYADFVYRSFGRKYGLAVTPKKVVSISANIDGGQPWRRTVGDYNLVYTDWQRDNFFRAVQGEIANKGLVGIEFDHVLRGIRSAAVPHIRLRPFVRRAVALLRSRSGSGVARRYRHGA
jgi:creatinase